MGLGFEASQGGLVVLVELTLNALFTIFVQVLSAVVKELFNFLLQPQILLLQLLNLFLQLILLTDPLHLLLSRTQALGPAIALLFEHRRLDY